jgi:hypothetical protein
MPKTLSISLFTTPYVIENTYTGIRVAEAALKRGEVISINNIKEY